MGERIDVVDGALRHRGKGSPSGFIWEGSPHDLVNVAMCWNYRRLMNPSPQIDLNCDLGEGCAFDAELMPLITSANIACGGHAGDANLAATALAEAKRYGVQVGAHPSFVDREHFGRRELELCEADIWGDCLLQLANLRRWARAAGMRVKYLKPHGALYNMACRDETYAHAVLLAAALFELALVGLPGSELQKQCGQFSRHVRFVSEGFADRRYRPDGSLVPRDQPGAFVTAPAEAVQQAKWLIRERGVQTLCVHGDNPQAVEFIRALRAALTSQGFLIRAF